MALFAGTYHATIDDKGRVVLPAAFKKALGVLKVESIILEKNRLDSCLNIHPVAAWQKKVDAFEAKMNKSTTNPAHYRMLKAFYRSFDQVNVATNGRINIPDGFLDFADLKGQVTFLGMGSSISLSTAASFQEDEISDEDYLDMLRQFDE